MSHPVLLPQADELLAALARLNNTLTEVRRAAGSGASPEIERELLAHLRSLRALLGESSLPLVEDVVDAARRVLDAADPAAPLKVLEMAQHTLATLLRRQAGSALPSAA